MHTLRTAISPEEAARATAAAAANAATALPRDVSIVAAYAAVRNELSATPLINSFLERDVAVALPRVIPHERQLVFHRITHLSELRPAKFRLLEPVPTAPVVPLGRIDLLIVPGLAFDARGNRLGWGRGHYDVTLAEAPHALRVGYAYECQVIDAVPSTSFDCPMDLVITEQCVRRTQRRQPDVQR